MATNAECQTERGDEFPERQEYAVKGASHETGVPGAKRSIPDVTRKGHKPENRPAPYNR